jgi:hypothetical protein
MANRINQSRSAFCFKELVLSNPRKKLKPKIKRSNYQPVRLFWYF